MDVLTGSVAFFTGAGVSVGSGMPTYRGPAGLYTAGAMPPLHHRLANVTDIGLVWEHLRTVVGVSRPPAPAHTSIADYVRLHPGSSVVTQNIDGLHEAAGTPIVHSLHGSAAVASCLDPQCAARQATEALRLDDEGVPTCATCGVRTRPDVVLFGEMLDSAVFADARAALADVDHVVVVGTSLEVTPAANLVFDVAAAGHRSVQWVNPHASRPGWLYAARSHSGPADLVLPRLLGVDAR